MKDNHSNSIKTSFRSYKWLMRFLVLLSIVVTSLNESSAEILEFEREVLVKSLYRIRDSSLISKIEGHLNSFNSEKLALVDAKLRELRDFFSNKNYRQAHMVSPLIDISSNGESFDKMKFQFLLNDFRQHLISNSKMPVDMKNHGINVIENIAHEFHRELSREDYLKIINHLCIIHSKK